MPALPAAVMITAALLCASCGAVGGADDTAETEARQEGVYEIVTLDLGGGVGTPFEYIDDETDPQALAEALTAQLAEQPEETGCGPAIPEGVTAPQVTVTGSSVTVAYEADYGELGAVTEILSRAAVVETLTQIPGVSFVTFTVAGAPLTDASGTPVGYMQASDFISGISRMDEAVTEEFSLWFLNAETGELEPVRREVTFAGHTTRETAVVRALIDGPDDEGHLPTLPPTTSLVNVQVRDSICYVNLGREFLDEALDLEANIPVDSLVLTLLELEDVDMVQILVEGSTDVVFRDLIPLDTVFAGTAAEMGILPVSAPTPVPAAEPEPDAGA